MKKTTIADLSCKILIMSDEISELQREVKFLSNANVYSSVASVIILIILGFVCFSIF